MKSLCLLLLLPMLVLAEEVPLEVTPVEPERTEMRGDVLFADFGQDAYGTLEIAFPNDPSTGAYTVRLGEKLDANGAIDRKPPGSVNFREIALVPHARVCKLVIPGKPSHNNREAVKMPAVVGEVTPFRYAEIEGPIAVGIRLRQLAVRAPFREDASAFECSDPTLDAVWKLCKQTMKVTTAFGIYIDGERERVPYEADAYINLLSHYACDLDPRVARATFDRLIAHPTWPTEWSLHMPMIAEADYEATGDPVLAARHYETLKSRLLAMPTRPDGLLIASAIVDWPASERDGYNDGKVDPHKKKQAGPMVNTVANAFYFRALESMARLAAALGNSPMPGRLRERRTASAPRSMPRSRFRARNLHRRRRGRARLAARKHVSARLRARAVGARGERRKIRGVARHGVQRLWRPISSRGPLPRG